MFAQEKVGQPHELTGLERLGLRVSEMINSPLAQLGRRVLIRRLDTDSDQSWHAIMELLADTEGLDMTFCGDGLVILHWGGGSVEVHRICGGDELKVIGNGAVP